MTDSTETSAAAEEPASEAPPAADPEQAAAEGETGATAPTRWPRVVLGLGIVAGLTVGLGLAVVRPGQVGVASEVYYQAGRAVLAGRDFYAFTLADHPGFGFLYPPAAALVFVPYALLGDPWLAFALQTATNFAAVGVLGWVLVRTIERERSLAPVDRALIYGYALASAGMAESMVMGQVNAWLAAGIAAGAFALERDRSTRAGVVLAGVAFVKLFPALVGAWLLRRRAWRAIVAATATGVGLLALGVVVFGDVPLETYLTETLPGEASVATFEDGPDPSSPYLTVRRQLAVLAPWIPAPWLLPAALAVLAPVVVACYRTVETLVDRLVALQATLLAMLVAFPLETFYLSLVVFPTVALAYLLDGGWTRRLFLAGTLVVSMPVTMTTVEHWGRVLPPGVAGSLLEVARAGFGVALPTMVGVWLLFAACVLYQHRAATGRSTPAGSGESG